MGARDARQASTEPGSEIFHEVWPLDIAILKLLPNEDAMLGGIHYQGLQVRTISEDLGEHVRSSQINTRLRISKLNGFAIDRPATGGRVWQRTFKGEAYLRENGHLNG